ncbi:MAG: hypothetical protein LQ345_007046 [Seirophora villosa]|nr:MAG: hypothetical protein LQ345_007046 [Seirophora villosa]
MILLFPSNNRYDIDASKTHCDFIMLPGLQKPFVACNGVGDPDRTATFNIVSTALLGAVPMAAWSKTFRASSRKPILLLWVLLLSSSHVFFNLILPNVSYNFQICPRSHIESLPQTNYQAAPLDFTWHSSLYALVSGQRQQQSTRTVNETTTSSCLYSCFANGAYIGRSSREIGVYYQASDRPNTRWGAITIWWAFTAIGLITFFTAERPDLLPHVAHKSLFIFRPSPSVRTAWSKCFGRDDSRDGQQKEWQISAITVVRVFAQWLSAGAFIGTTIYNESRALDINAENFSAVGQWGGVAVVVQVLIAASVGYLWRTVKRDGPNTLGDGTRCTGSPTGGTGEISCVDEESGKEEWNCKVGYAS